jgi:hypothetical protein
MLLRSIVVTVRITELKALKLTPGYSVQLQQQHSSTVPTKDPTLRYGEGYLKEVCKLRLRIAMVHVVTAKC